MGRVEMHGAVGAPVAVIEVEMTKETLEPGRNQRAQGGVEQARTDVQSPRIRKVNREIVSEGETSTK